MRKLKLFNTNGNIRKGMVGMNCLVEDFKNKEHLLVEVLTSIMDIVYLKDAHGHWIEANDYVQNLFRFAQIQWLGKKDHELASLMPQYKDFFIKVSRSDEKAWEKGTIHQFEEQISDHTGQVRTYSIIKLPLFEQDGSRKALLVLGKDITLEKNNKLTLANTLKQLADFKFALDQSSIVATTDSKGKIIYANDKFCEISKYGKEELIGQDHRILNSGHHSKQFFRDMWKTIRKGECWRGEIKNRAKDGTFYWVKTTIIPFLNEEGIPYQYIAIRQDITEQKVITEQIFHNAYHDDLTNLRNRRRLREDLTEWILQNEDKSQMALIFMDLNRFKYINDTLGHNVGDQILRDVSKRLSLNLHEEADLYRFGGDEFIIVLKDKSEEEINEYITEIKSLFLTPFYFKQERIYLSASLGVSLFPRDGKDVETLVKKADSAMYLAKKMGNNSVQFYTGSLFEDMKRTMQLESALRHAIEEEQFILYYQPQVELKTKEIIGVEALIRWEHPTLGIIPPSEFIPLAEETGLITPISEWVLETACKQNKEWQQSGKAPIRMGVNISSVLFKEDLVEMVTRILKKTKLEPCYLELEITESLMQTPELAISILNQLKSLGVLLSIDDFGTGYSSLAYLRDFPIDSLKIDRTFINEIQKDNGAIVKMIISMASLLNVSVIAEGIETEEQFSFLSKLRCDEGQGYLFSRPIPNHEVIKLLPTLKSPVSV